MKKLTTDEIRKEFLSYFNENGHKVVGSYPLVPPNDPSLLFTNAGMVQFKDVFTGKEKKDFKRAASSQKCVRAGGKHNDLENVGYTARHHTFFEMLGNFSFGDYFKRDAIKFGWDFLVNRIGLEPEKLWVSVFAGDPGEDLPPDDEAADIWENVIGLPKERILRLGKKDNFWAMGETGPCGPCSEIHYDQGDMIPCNEPGGCKGVECECDRYLEVWNLVFMQFDRSSSGELSPLPAPCIDTGMGLERLAVIVQGGKSNYDTDLFTPLLEKMAIIADTAYGSSEKTDVSLRVVADHARATAFLMADGVLPSNEGRGYVLRRIMRRAIRHGAKLGVDDLFFYEVCLEVVRTMSETYPELKANAELIEKATRLEEETFRKTLANGLRLLEREMSKLREEGETTLPGKLVFDLKTRDGFPTDLTAVIAREHGMDIDEEAYEQNWRKHQEVSAGSLGLSGIDDIYKEIIKKTGPVSFCGYEKTESQGTVKAVVKQTDGKLVEVQKEQDPGELEFVISPTPFYGESGGQVGDTGAITTEDGLEIEITSAIKPVPDLIVLQGKLKKGSVSIGDKVIQRVDTKRRQDIRLNHSATHLLQSALRKVLGDHVNQKGSLVAPDRLRFDFSHFSHMSQDEIMEVEQKVNAMIRENLEIQIQETDLEHAREQGATMLFGEKYSEKVRMVKMGDKSLELCGGTHAERTGDIGMFKIISEGAVQAGVRRIEATTGSHALTRTQKLETELRTASKHLNAKPEELSQRIISFQESHRLAMRQIDELKQKLAAGGAVRDIISEAKEICGVKVLATRVEGIKLSSLRDFVDHLRDKLGGGIVLVAAQEDGKLSTVCSVSKEITKKVKAGDLLKAFFEHTGGRGGGRPDFAQGGGGDPEKVPEALEDLYSVVEKALSA